MQSETFSTFSSLVFKFNHNYCWYTWCNGGGGGGGGGGLGLAPHPGKFMFFCHIRQCNTHTTGLFINSEGAARDEGVWGAIWEGEGRC